MSRTVVGSYILFHWTPVISASNKAKIQRWKGQERRQVDNSPVLCVQASSSSPEEQRTECPGTSLIASHSITLPSQHPDDHASVRKSIHFLKTPLLVHFLLIRKCSKQSSETISTADNQCYLPATGFETSLFPKGYYFHRLPWWCDAAVSLPFCCFPMQSHHTLGLNHLSHLSQAFLENKHLTAKS